MNFRPFLPPDSISLRLATTVAPGDDAPEGFDPESARNVKRIKDETITELSTLLDRGGQIVNPSRLARDLMQRESQTPSGLGHGVAIPHVRTLQARSFAMAFGRSVEPLPWASSDDEPVRIFFAMAAPPHDDRSYLRVYRSLARAILDEGILAELHSVEEPSEVLRILKNID